MSVTPQVNLRFVKRVSLSDDNEQILQQQWAGTTTTGSRVDGTIVKEVVEEWRDVPLVLTTEPAEPDTVNKKTYRFAVANHSEAFFFPGDDMHDALDAFQTAHRNLYVIAITEL